jgi:uncharacterized protein YgfB (UPF0149 family)
MTRSAEAPSYPRIARALAGAGVDASPAEAHGIACGLLCAGEPGAFARWEEELLEAAGEGDVLAEECRRGLRRLYDGTLMAMEGDGMSFAPFLPDEERPLAERAVALREWCEGFLYGFGLSGGAPEKALSAEGREALHDFGELTRLDAEHVAEGEGEESALAEIVEFAWVAALVIRDECRQYRERP